MTYVTGPWSDDELRMLTSMDADGVPRVEIAKALNRPHQGVTGKLTGIERQKEVKARKAPRICLKCREPFLSEWEGNRLCARHQ